ncbi:TPA: DUF2073 domain-containing protein [Candidatus Woesearchaeota archaeon]|nr:DUF2073 domain-containing protein [Candidatus Woesearchaeota archaeon]HIH39380.1 DUF2073 domain-containing protein [Candidatus Woesearchaeota archaeon]
MVTLQLMPYSQIEGLSSLGRIRKLLDVAKDDTVVLLQGRLKPEEETELIKATMEKINKDFKGIELAVVKPGKTKEGGFASIKNDIINAVLGDRQGFTLVGPANIVKAIKKDPDRIQLMMNKSRKRR